MFKLFDQRLQDMISKELTTGIDQQCYTSPNNSDNFVHSRLIFYKIHF